MATMMTERLRKYLGKRARLVDTPLRLENTKRRGAPWPAAARPIPELNDSAVEKAAIERDYFCCRMCGFVSRQYQRAFSPSGSRRDIDQLVTACLFCFQCFHLDLVGAMQSGVLIWAPEVSQAELHHIAREIYVARLGRGDTAERARVCLAAILARRTVARERIGTDDPSHLSDLLEKGDWLAPGDDVARSVRLFPLDRMLIRKGGRKVNLFPPALHFWRSTDGPYASGPRSAWPWLDHGWELLASSEVSEGRRRSPVTKETAGAKKNAPKSGDEKDLAEFIYARDPKDDFRFYILRLKKGEKEYERVGTYEVIDVTEEPEISESKIENMISILRGNDPSHHVGPTGTRMIFKIQRRKSKTDPMIAVYMTEDDQGVTTKNAILSLAQEVVDDMI